MQKSLFFLSRLAFLLSLTLAIFNPVMAVEPVAVDPKPAAIQPVIIDETAPLVVFTQSSHHKFIVEVARTDQQKATGLMGRTELGANEGMIFIIDPPQPITMWMKDTLIPLDMLFINKKGRISRIFEAKPNDETLIPSNGEVIAVIELAAGTLKKFNIRLGDRIVTPVLAPM